MALPTTAARGLACCSCRQWVLRSFIASIGGPSIASTPPTSQRRTFAAPTRRYNEARERTQQAEKEIHALNDINVDFSQSSGHASVVEAKPQPEHEVEIELEEQSEDPKPETPYVPWYLQVDSPIAQQEDTTLARQQLPDIPDHSPDLLEPLLQRVSVELGMDDLTLLDLRELDPPPALGANLFMLVGTARSEKHLHVSADKLCRWLRSEYHLTPFADGLLGRQELKVKMRRRAKKSKLLSAVNAKSTMSSELDDGIRTGWVCVNVGRIEGGELPKTEADIEAEKKIVGFGTRTKGCHIVVQLMTEEKRADLDLEKLWSDLLWRSKKTKEEQAKKAAEEAKSETIALESASEINPVKVEDPDRLAPQSTVDPSLNMETVDQPQARV